MKNKTLASGKSLDKTKMNAEASNGKAEKQLDSHQSFQKSHVVSDTRQLECG